MILSLLEDLNWAAVGVSIVVAFVTGLVWFAPKVFGTAWATQVSRYSGIPLSDLDANGKRPSTLGKWFLVIALSGVALALVVEAAGADSMVEGVVAGAVLGAGIGAAFFTWPVIFALVPWRWWLISTGSFIVMQVTMGAILAAWR